MQTRQIYDLEKIKDMLLAQLDSVVAYYAPPVSGSYSKFGRYFTLNPGRADRSVGSFCVKMSGADAGRWNDYATKSGGDILDLIDLAMHGQGQQDLKAALKEARTYLGLDSEDPAQRRRREDAVLKSNERRREAEKGRKAAIEKRRRRALAIYLSAQEALRGTPVEFYLRDDRAIDLAKIGRQPRALRFHPECFYYHEDQETGEVSEGKFPAMVAAVTDAKGNFLGVHRTYLALIDGCWRKAPVADPKLTLGPIWTGGINIWAGIGPRGGKPGSLPQCPPGTHVYLTEGIEDALSVVTLLPEVRVVCAMSLGNLAAIRLPKNVTDITLVADRDANATALEARELAIASHQKRGRDVRVYLNNCGGKDLNDALQAARKNTGAA